MAEQKVTEKKIKYVKAPAPDVKKGKKAVEKLDKLTAKKKLDAAAAKAAKASPTVQVVKTINKQRDNFLASPMVIRLLVIFLAYGWFKKARQQREDEENIVEAIKFLRESRGFQS